MCPRIVAQVDNRRRDPAPYSLLVVRGCVVTSNGRARVRRRTPVAPAAPCTAAFAMGLSARPTRRRMEFTSRETWTLIHGLILGTFFLLAYASGQTEDWHKFGMEWKEHIAWISPMLATLAVFLVFYYGPVLARNRTARLLVLVVFTGAFATAAIAGLFGALITKTAPIT